MKPLISQAGFLAACSGHRVTIYIRSNESYGIQTFSDAFRAYLESAAIHTEVRRVGAMSLVRGLIMDRRTYGLSVVSTWHGALAFLNRRGSIYILHGFPTRDYPLARFLFLWFVTWISARLTWLVVSNSTLTHVINSKIFRIESDVIWNPLRSGQVHVSLPSLPDLSGRPRRMAFIGRAVPGKHAFEAAETFLRCHDLSNWTMTVIGQVEDARLLQLASREARLQLLGKLPHADALAELRNVRVVVSLNPLEPYGFVYQEAAESGALIVAPALAGAAESLRTSYASRLILLPEFSVGALQDALERAARQSEGAQP